MPSSKRSAFKGLNVLISSGPTSVPIDAMRVITNRSSGEMGRLLAAAFQARGARVTMLEGAVTTSVPLANGIKVKKFYFFDDLADLLGKELRRPFDIVLHAAAVSDFSLKKPLKGKLSSRNDVCLMLHPTRKLIGMIKAMAPETRLVGFKFEPDIHRASTIAKAQRLIDEHSCTDVVLNEYDGKGYRALILSADGSRTRTVFSKSKLVELLLSVL